MRKPTNLPSASHHLLLGNWGSVSCHFGVQRRRMLGSIPLGMSRKVPPQTTPLGPVSSMAHSPGLPSMSWRPNLLGALVPTGWVRRPLLPAYQVVFSRVALSVFQGPITPARQAHSHSASVGRRYFLPVAFASQ